MEDVDSVYIKYNFTCPICQKFLTKLVECKKCNKLFCRSCAEKKQKNNEECIYCGAKPFIVVENVGIQRLINNGEIKPKCSYCEKEFDSGKEFDEHKCTGERYECKICKEKFRDKNMFWDHLIKSHEDELIKEIEKK